MQHVQSHDQDRPATADATNEQCLDRYARILVEHAIGLREGQPLFIYCELIHRDFALRVGEAAYSAG
ncbi:MAG: aminopeptidase, partial [bacterium]|nr:aminopeptidase [bacterium]